VPGIGLLLDPCQERLFAQAHGVGGERLQRNRYGLGPSRVGLAGQRLSGTPCGMGVFPGHVHVVDSTLVVRPQGFRQVPMGRRADLRRDRSLSPFAQGRGVPAREQRGDDLSH
jgi:hypothetical protein